MTELSFKSRIKKAEDAVTINSMIIYGEPGIGKTWFAASADAVEAMSPVLIVDVEGSASGVGRGYPEVDVIEVSSHEQFTLVVDELLEKEHDYKTVIIDTFNVAQERAEEFFAAMPENQNNSFGVFRMLKSWSIRLARRLHHAPFASVMIMHENTEKDDATGRVLTGLKITGSAKSTLPAIADIIGHMRTIKDKDDRPVVALVTSKVPGTITKNRYGITDPIVSATGQLAPSMVDLLSAVVEASSTDTDTDDSNN